MAEIQAQIRIHFGSFAIENGRIRIIIWPSAGCCKRHSNLSIYFTQPDKEIIEELERLLVDTHQDSSVLS